MPSKLKFLKTAVSYQIPVPPAAFLRLIKRESPLDNSYTDEPDLLDDLEKLPGVDNVDYNGHYGSSIFFQLAAENDTAADHKRIVEVIERHLGKK